MTKLTFLFFFFSLSLCAQDFTFDKEKGKAVPNFLCQLKLMKGQVFKKSGEDLIEVKVGERFNKNDTIVTGEKSLARIMVVDDTTITIGPSSELNFTDFEYTDKDNRKLLYNLIKGQLSGHVRQKAKDGDIQFKTKYTVLGVRGTEILMNFRTVNNVDVSEYALLSGKAVITDDKNAAHEIAKGERVVFLHDSVKQTSAIEKMKLSKEEMKNIKAMKLEETKEFKPMMPFYNPLAMNQNSATETSSGSEEGAVEEKRTDKKHWKENLEQLNKNLKENAKKR
jgi:hypothetical protein